MSLYSVNRVTCSEIYALSYNSTLLHPIFHLLIKKCLKFVRSLQPGISIMFHSLLWFKSMITKPDVSTLQSSVFIRGDFNFRSPLMKTLDWSVETLGLDYNSTGLCNHLFKPRVASKT